MTRPMRKTTIALPALMLLVDAGPTFAAPTEPESTPEISLTDLLASRFGDLSLAEKRLVAATEIGETADCKDLSGDSKKIRGDLLAWLCTNPQATSQLTYKGISLGNAVIIGKVDLQSAKISFPIQAWDCTFEDTIELSRSQIGFLNLRGSSIKDLHADSTHFDQSVFLRDGFKASGGVRLASAIIDGQLDCSGGQFIGNDRVFGLNANGVEVKESVLLSHGFKAEGGVNLNNAKIDGNLECSGGQFVSKGVEDKQNGYGTDFSAILSVMAIILGGLFLLVLW